VTFQYGKKFNVKERKVQATSNGQQVKELKRVKIKGQV
jgi:hypothetical protein